MTSSAKYGARPLRALFKSVSSGGDQTKTRAKFDSRSVRRKFECGKSAATESRKNSKVIKKKPNFSGERREGERE